MNPQEIARIVNTILVKETADAEYLDLDLKSVKLLVSYFLSYIPENIQKEKFPQFCEAIGPEKVFHVFWLYYSLQDLGYLITPRREKTPQKVRNIAICVLKLGGAGTERVVSLLSQLYTDMGYNVIILIQEAYTQKDFPYAGTYEWLGDSEYLLNLDKIIKKHNIDTIEFHDFDYRHSLFSLWYLSKFSDVNTILFKHFAAFSPVFTDESSLFLDYKISRLANLCVVLSRRDQAYLHHHIGNSVVMMPNPLTFDPNHVEQAPLDGKTVIFAGRLELQKNVPFLIDSFEKVVEQVPDARLMIIGAGSDRKHIKRKIQKLKLSQNIEMISHTSDISSYLAKSSVHVLPSLYEGLPMIMLEAKAYGLPSVVTKMDNLEFQYYGGYISVEQGDKEGFAQELIKLLNDQQYRLQMGKEAKASLKHFSSESLKKRWQRIFDGFSNSNLYELDLLQPDPSLELFEILDHYYESILYLKRMRGYTSESYGWAYFSTLSFTEKIKWLVRYTLKKILPYRLIMILKSLKKSIR